MDKKIKDISYWKERYDIEREEVVALGKRVKELEDSMVRHFQEEHLAGDGPEIDRWKRKVKELEELLEENNRLSEEWQKCHDWNNKIVDENQNLKTKVKELEGVEQERERLSKLLIAERMKTVELKEGIKLAIGYLRTWGVFGNESTRDACLKELYKLVGLKQNKSLDFLNDKKEDIYTESDGTELKEKEEKE